MEQRFYHLTRLGSLAAAVQLAEKVNSQGRSLEIICSAERSAQLSAALWSDSPFLPHAEGKADGYSKILLSQSPSGFGDVQFYLDDVKAPESMEGLDEKLICYLFHASEAEHVALRRADWK